MNEHRQRNKPAATINECSRALPEIPARAFKTANWTFPSTTNNINVQFAHYFIAANLHETSPKNHSSTGQSDSICRLDVASGETGNGFESHHEEKEESNLHPAARFKQAQKQPR